MHTLLDYDGGLPLYVNITDGKTGDNKGAYDIPIQKGAVIVADRYYNDFPMLNVWDSTGASFVVRHKDNLKYAQTKERELFVKIELQKWLDNPFEKPPDTAKYGVQGGLF